jgi:hypothetical protein
LIERIAGFSELAREKNGLEVRAGAIEILAGDDYNLFAVAPAHELGTALDRRIDDLGKPVTGYGRLPCIGSHGKQIAGQGMIVNYLTTQLSCHEPALLPAIDRLAGT